MIDFGGLLARILAGLAIAALALRSVPPVSAIEPADPFFALAQLATSLLVGFGLAGGG